jgi:hypothetical protein
MLTPAHLLDESWRIADVLLYGGAALGMTFGISLFLWGRRERLAATRAKRNQGG